MKKFLAVCFCLVLLLGMTACSITDDTVNDSTQSKAEEASSQVESADPLDELKKYTSDSGITIYMADGFKEKDLGVDTVACYFESDNAIFTCSVESFELLESLNFDADMSLEEYGQLVIDANGFDSKLETDEYGNVYMKYVQNIEGNDFTYYGYFKKGAESFWTCNLVCLTESEAEFEDDFALWASTIEIA